MDKAVIAITGSPSSGKTTTAINIAKDLSDYKDDINILIIFDDLLSPSIPYLFNTNKNKSADDERSIANILTSEMITDEILFENLIINDDNKKILALGYKYKDNYRMYAKYSQIHVERVFIQLKSLFDFIIVDTNCDFYSSILSLASIKMADVILNVHNKSAGDFSYTMSNRDSILSEKEYTCKLYDIVNASLEEQNMSEFDEFITHLDFQLDYVEEIHAQFLESTMMKKATSKKAKKYRKAIEEIVEKTIIRA